MCAEVGALRAQGSKDGDHQRGKIVISSSGSDDRPCEVLCKDEVRGWRGSTELKEILLYQEVQEPTSCVINVVSVCFCFQQPLTSRGMTVSKLYPLPSFLFIPTAFLRVSYREREREKKKKKKAGIPERLVQPHGKQPRKLLGDGCKCREKKIIL